MLRQIEGSRAVADAVAMCRPEVICAYPITPQTHIVEALGAKVKAGKHSRRARSARPSAGASSGSWYWNGPSRPGWAAS